MAETLDPIRPELVLGGCGDVSEGNEKTVSTVLSTE